MEGTRPRILAFALVLVGAAGTASAQSTGSVTGNVRPPDPRDRGDEPALNQGFVERIKNPIIPTRPFDPLSWVIVVLEPMDSLSDEDKQPPKVAPKYALAGEAFEQPLFSTTVGGELEITNRGRSAHRIHAPGAPDLMAPDPINPGGQRTVKVTAPHTLIELRGADEHHVRGALVAFPLRYHATVKPDGSFEIPDVPAGKWTVKMWYRDGWLRVSPQTITVSPRRATSVKLVLPPNLQVDAPGGGGQ